MQNLRKYAVFAALVIAVCIAFGAFAGYNVKNIKNDISTFSVTASADENASVVYMTTEITSEALVKIYERLDFDDVGKTAVKISTGESQNSNNLAPDLIKDLVRSVDGTLVECNTAYGGNRGTTARHKQAIEQRGYLEIANVDLLDEDGETAIPIENGTRITTDYIGSHLGNYDNLICLSHFKGHAMAGYGGAIKNMSIGIATSTGKVWIHSGGTRTSGSIYGDQNSFLEAMADATSGVIDYMEGKVVYINVMNNLSVDCDCDGNPSTPTIHDMGILASYDPVALDKACLDLIYNHVAEEGENTQTFINRVTGRNGLYTLEYAEGIGIGTQEYKLQSIDDENVKAAMTYEEGVLKIDNAPQHAVLLHASYDENGVLQEVKQLEVKAEQEVAVKNGDKLFLWGSLTDMIPLCEAVEIVKSEPEPKRDTIVVYFSFQGSTKALAESIEKVTDADIWRMVPKEEYGEENLKYYDSSTRAYIEQYNPSMRPEFLDGIDNLGDYDTIILGYPIWYGKAPRIILTFLDTYKDDLNGKTIIPFCTSGSSGISGSLSEIRNAVPNSTVKDGFRGTANMTAEQIKSRLEANDYDFN